MIGWIVETLIASTLLMLLVMLLREPVRQHIGPHAAYALWLLPTARMLLPPLPVAPGQAPMDRLPVLVLSMDLGAGVAEPLAASALPPAMLLLAIWLGGAVLFLGWHLIAYRHFVAQALSGAEQLPGLDRGRVEVCASSAAASPFAAGILVKSVVLPVDWRLRYDAAELRLALEHEFAHHRRCDLSANLVALVVLSLHWFNPVAHRAHRAFRSDQELACDAEVLARGSIEDRHAYGSALVKSAIGRRPIALAPLGSGDDLKRRLKMMKQGHRSGRAGRLVSAAVVASGLALTVSGGTAAEAGHVIAQGAVAEVQSVAPPAVPSPPAAPEPPALPPAPQDRVGEKSNPISTVIIRRDWSDLSAKERADFDARVARSGERAAEAGTRARAASEAAARAGARANEAGEAAAWTGVHAARAGETARLAAARCAMRSTDVREVEVDGRRQRVIICNSDGEGLSDEAMLRALEAARQGLAEAREALSETRRSTVLGQIDRQIEELRARIR